MKRVHLFWPFFIVVISIHVCSVSQIVLYRVINSVCNKKSCEKCRLSVTVSFLFALFSLLPEFRVVLVIF